MRFRIYSLLGLLVCGATLSPWPSAQARNTLALLNAQQISPKSQIVDFRQTQFVFARGSSLDTDWGQVSVDVENMKLRGMLGTSGGYLNVVLHDSRLGGPFWVVENLRIPPDSDCRQDGLSSNTLREEQVDTSRKTPMSAYFDLRPGIEGSGSVNRLRAAVLVSTGPLPPVLSIWNLLEQASPEEFRVSQQINNAEGDLGEAAASTPPSTGPC